MSSFSQSCLEAIAIHLETNCDNLRASLVGFPPPNLRLKLPSATSYFSNLDFTPNTNNYLIKSISRDESEKTEMNLYSIGNYEGEIKLDLWANSRQELDDIYEEVFLCLNPNAKTGVDLELVDYHQRRANYLFNGVEDLSDEESSREDNWRFRLNLLLTSVACSILKEYYIERTELKAKITT